ncbi:hypothetical protein [Okeania sp. SIO2B3]|nr:hypothetical protein [Okeania sp. SIO2B3]
MPFVIAWRSPPQTQPVTRILCIALWLISSMEYLRTLHKYKFV